MAGPEVTVAIIAELQRRSIRAATTELNKEFAKRDVEVGADVKAAEIKAAAEKIKREFADIRAQVKVDVDRSAVGGIREIGNAARDTERAVAGVGRAGKAAAGGLSDIGKTGFQSARGMLALGAAVAGIPLIEVAKTAVTASQSIFLLPAAATAAAAGIGTLHLATADFAQTIKDIRDPKKFAADIQTLAPAAQQAALQIQNLLPAFDRLKQATEEAFFANASQRISQLATTYQPVIQNMTTTIASAFNSAIGDVSNLLLQPGTQSQIAEITTNIGAAFQNAMPAVRSFTQAFLDIAQVGSQFLPGLGTSISEVAANFADFIRQARDSGQLHVWIQEGINAAKLLGQAIWDIGKFIYDVFGSNGQENVNNFKDTLAGVNEVLHAMNGDFSLVGANITDQLQKMSNSGNIWEVGFQQNIQSIRNAFADIPETFQTVTRALGTMVNDVKHLVDGMITNLVNDLNHMADILPDKANKVLFGTEHPKPFSFTPAPDVPLPTVGDWRDASPAAFAPGQHADRNIGGATPAGKYRTRFGDIRPLPRPGDPNAGSGLPFSGPLVVPPPPPDTSGGKPSDKDRLDAIKSGLDPSLYKVDPFAPVPGLPSPGALYGGPMPGGGYGAASGQEFFEGQQKILDQAHDLEEKRKQRLALERDNQSSAQDIEKAKWDEHQAEVDLQKAQAALVDKTKGTAKDLKQGMTELSAGLDPDLGLGKGLSGLADNLVRFAGKMAFAGTERGLQDTIDETEARTGIKGGYGLLGMRGASNLEQGLSPLLGNPLAAGATQSGTTGGTSVSGALSALPGASGGYPGDAALLANVPAGRYTQTQGADLTQGLADCSSAVEDLVNLMDGRPTAGRSMSTGNEAQWLTERGFLPGMGGPGDFRVGFNSGHTQATLPGGTPFNWGSDAAAARGGVGGTGADDPAFTSHFYRPGGAGAAGLGGAGGLGGGGGVVPVYVTNMGGMGAGGAAAALPGGGGGAAPASGGGGHLANWDAIMGAEAGGSGGWTANTGNGFHGGLQFTPSSWAAAGGTAFAPSAEMASPEQQKTVADKLLQMQGPGAWPATSAAHPDWFNGTGGSAPSTTGIPAPAGASPAVADILSRMPANGGAPLAPGGGQSPILNQYQPGVGAGLGLNPAGTAPFPPLSPDAGSPAPGNIGGIPVPASVVPGVGHGLGLTPNGLGGAPIPGSPDAPLPLGGVGPDTTRIGGLAPAESINPGGAGFGIMPGGTIDSLIQGGLQAAGSAGGMFGGGAGGAAASAAAQTLMKLANRAIQFGGQAAGIGVQGLMDTFLPTGGSELAQNNWFTRIAGAVGAAAPALPNLAGGALGQAQQQGPLTPEQVAANGNQHGMANGAAPGPPQINITQNNEHTGPLPAEQSAAAIGDNMRTAAQAPVAGNGWR